MAEIQVECAGVAQKVTIHSLPCHIKYDGVAPVSIYFQPTQDEQTNLQASSSSSSIASEQLYKAHFRGRRLKGVSVPVPPNYQGVVFRETLPLEEEEDVRRWSHRYSFDSFVCWGHDEAPSLQNELVRVADWLHVAEVLHGPASGSTVTETDTAIVAS